MRTWLLRKRAGRVLKSQLKGTPQRSLQIIPTRLTARLHIASDWDR